MILLILVIALILRLINLNQSFWIDEIAQVMESSRSFWQQWNIPIDFHPPLYHYLVYFWLRISKLEWWLRTTSVLAGVLTVYFTYLLGCKITSKKVARLTALFLAISPFHIYYSQELRPYALSCLLAAISMYLFSKILDSKKSWFLNFILINILGFYSLYFFPFILASQFFILLLAPHQGAGVGFLKKEKLFVWLKNVFIAFLFFLPWVPFFLRQLETGREWTRTSPTWAKMVSTPWPKALPLVFAKFALGRVRFNNNALYLGLALILFSLFVFCLFKAFKKKRKETLFFFLYFSTPIFLSFIITIFLPVIRAKRLLLSTPAFYCLIALGIFSLPKRFRKITLFFFLLSSFFGLFQQNFNPENQREQWRQAVRFVEERAERKDLVLFEISPPLGAWQWYQKRGVVTALLPRAKEKEYADKVKGLTENKNRVFIFQYLFELTDPEFSVLSVLKEQGFQRVDFFEFPGVGLIYEYKKIN